MFYLIWAMQGGCLADLKVKKMHARQMPHVNMTVVPCVNKKIPTTIMH